MSEIKTIKTSDITVAWSIIVEAFKASTIPVIFNGREEESLRSLATNFATLIRQAQYSQFLSKVYLAQEAGVWSDGEYGLEFEEYLHLQILLIFNKMIETEEWIPKFRTGNSVVSYPSESEAFQQASDRILSGKKVSFWTNSGEIPSNQ